MEEEVVELRPIQKPDELTTFESGSKYESYQSDGVYAYQLLPNGRPNKKQVKITYNHGDVYEGNMKHGKYSGNGKYSWQNGSAYEGNFKREFNGSGKFTAANGDIYQGNFKSNKYEGKGLYTWADGSTFKGEFKNGQILNGRYTDADGNVYYCNYTYKRNGERKSGNIQLIRFAEKKNSNEKVSKKEVTKEKKEAKTKKADKSGLLSKDEKLLSVIKKSKRGAEFKNLYMGAAGINEKSEKALLAILNYFSGSDADQMARIFKSSKLYDPTKGQEHTTDMISGVIKRSADFSASTKKSVAKQNASQNAANASKGAAK